MGRRLLVVGQLRVQSVDRSVGWKSFTIVEADGRVHEGADRFLALHDGSGTQRTYAYCLVDHLRWCVREGLAPGRVTLRDLERYMGAVGAKIPGPLGVPWRVGKRPYGDSALSTAAACLKGFYLEQAKSGVNRALAEELDRSRLPTRADRRRRLLGHVTGRVAANPLAPQRVRRRHPKMLPEGAKEKLLPVLTYARDRLVVQWLADGGLRIGELCGLHLADLHLRSDAACGECRSPHVHVCRRHDNPNDALAKGRVPWSVEDGTVIGGLIKRVSPAMVHAYFDYIVGERRTVAAGHELLLVQLAGPGIGQAWAPAAARGMLRRAGRRAGLGRVRPHMFRHSFATAVLEASGGNLVVAREAGGWASTAMVDEIYAHVDLHDLAFDAALRTVWGQR